MTDWKLILQIAGVALGLLYLWLEYRADIRLWIVGLVMPAVHGTLYFASGLYADCGMQLYYILAGLYGWAVWHRTSHRSSSRSSGRPHDPHDPAASPAPQEPNVPPGSDTPDTPPPARPADAADAAVRLTPLCWLPGLAGACVLLHASIYLLLTRFTDSTVPFWDSLTTALCIVAYWMLSRRLAEQWLVWLAVDLVTVGLYAYKQLPLTAGLYALYSVLAVAGYLRWRRQASPRR